MDLVNGIQPLRSLTAELRYWKHVHWLDRKLQRLEILTTGFVATKSKINDIFRASGVYLQEERFWYDFEEYITQCNLNN